MCQLEVYVLCHQRSVAVANEFLDAFVPERQVCAEDFPFPEFSDQPQRIFATAKEIIEHLENTPNEAYGLYWDSVIEQGPRQAMLFYTEDNAMIAGLAFDGNDPAGMLLKLAQVTKGLFGYVTSEQRPGDTQIEFIEMCRDSEYLRLVDGEILAEK